MSQGFSVTGECDQWSSDNDTGEGEEGEEEEEEEEGRKMGRRVAREE